MSFSHTFSSSANSRNPTSPAPQPNAQGPDAILRMLNQIIGGVAHQPHPATRDAATQSPDGEPNVRVFTGGGPNFQYTATTRLTPRDANVPQARVPAIDNLPGILNHMFQAPPRGAGPDPNFEPLGFGNLLNTLFNPANMQHGDAVYSQEALDRIVSQLMEQNQSNAPGPASAEAIASLPQKSITNEDMDETTGKADCSICMDEALIGSQVTCLPCSHWFHPDCIKAWLTEHDTCPHCRQGIMPRDAPENATRPREPGQAARNNRAWGQGEGTRDDPINVAESPEHSRTTNDSASTGTPGSAPGVATAAWARMRDAFGGGSGGNNPPSGAS
jgi:E3 ubiquitin-protein ligase RNF115/126